MPRRVGAYAKLLAKYASDDAIIAAGEKAELLFVRGLAFCATSDSDGYITTGQVERVVGAGMRDARARAQTLVREGLWQSVEGGYQIRSWVKIHESAEEKGRIRATDRERKQRERETESDRIPLGQEPDSEEYPEDVTPESLDCSYGGTPTQTEQSRALQSRAAPQAETTPRKRGHRLPEDWAPKPQDIDWARERRIPDEAARRSTERFKNHWLDATGKTATKLDWSRAWRNWLDGDAERAGRDRANTATEKVVGIVSAAEIAKQHLRNSQAARELESRQRELPGA